MENQITICPTKKGNGYKVVINGTWFYTSKKELFKMLNNKASACKLRTISGNQSFNSAGH